MFAESLVAVRSRRLLLRGVATFIPPPSALRDDNTVSRPPPPRNVVYCAVLVTDSTVYEYLFRSFRINLIPQDCHLLGAIVKLRKATVSFVLSVLLGTARLLLDEFS